MKQNKRPQRVDCLIGAEMTWAVLLSAEMVVLVPSQNTNLSAKWQAFPYRLAAPADQLLSESPTVHTKAVQANSTILAQVSNIA